MWLNVWPVWNFVQQLPTTCNRVCKRTHAQTDATYKIPTMLCPFARGLTSGNLSKDVFERRTSTGSEVFSLLICLDANKFVLLSFSSLIKTIYPRFSTEPLPNDAKSPLPVDVRRSKTLLLKLPINEPCRETLKKQGTRKTHAPVKNETPEMCALHKKRKKIMNRLK